MRLSQGRSALAWTPQGENMAVVEQAKLQEFSDCWGGGLNFLNSLETRYNLIKFSTKKIILISLVPTIYGKLFVKFQSIHRLALRFCESLLCRERACEAP